MIHAYYCYDSDPIDRWFEEDINIIDDVYWDIKKYFPPDLISFVDESHWELHRHYGGMFMTLGGPLNNPKTSVLNAPAVWEYNKDDVINLEDTLVYEITTGSGKTKYTV